jgi:hypothetical protein
VLARKRGVERFERRSKDVKRGKSKEKKEKKYVYERMKEKKKKRKDRKRNGNKDMKWMNQVKYE